MARYKLRIPQTGDMLYGDERAIVADTLDAAREAWEQEEGEAVVYLHPHIGRCRVVYARDVENGECHDDAEAGDTTVDYLTDTGRELAENEVRCWERGGPSWLWNFGYSPPEPVSWREVPVGCRAYHPVFGSGEVVARPRKGAYGVRFPVRFGWPELRGPVRWLPKGCVSLSGTATWPGDRRRVTVTVDGEVVATGVREKTAEILRDMRCARLTAEWEAEMFAAYDARRVEA